MARQIKNLLWKSGDCEHPSSDPQHTYEDWVGVADRQTHRQTETQTHTHTRFPLKAMAWQNMDCNVKDCG